MNPRTVQRLLDRDEAAGLLAALTPSKLVRDAALETIWAKPGRHFNVCYRIDDGESVRLASLCVVNDAEAARAIARVDRERCILDKRHQDVAAVMVAPDVLAQAFPFDYRLPSLADCLRPDAVHEVLGDDAVDACEVAAYRPGIRCQVRYSHGSVARAYGKTAVERDPGRRRRMHRELCDATATTLMRVPALLGSAEAIGLDVVAAVGGRSLHEELAQRPEPGHVRTAVEALAELHACVPAPGDRVYTVADELALAQSWAQWMSLVEPAIADRLEGIAASLAAGAPSTAPATFAHRDFYDKQILFDGPRPWLLDVDTACTGDPELDLGNFLSQLFLRGLQWDRTAAHRELGAVAEEAYGKAARRPVTGWYRRTSLLRLACVYQLRPHWRHVVPALLDEAART